MYYTTDGKNLCPHPNMTDEQLYEFEKDMDVPDKTWKTLEEFIDYTRRVK